MKIMSIHETYYQTAILGAGGGGYPAAFAIARSGASTLLIDDKGNLGGHCLFEGCVPSKAIREGTSLAAFAHKPSKAGVSLTFKNPLRWKDVRDFKDGIQTRRYAQHMGDVQAAAHLTLVKGRGTIIDDHTLEMINYSTQETTRVRFANLIVATGSHAKYLPIPGGANTLTSHDLFAWQEALEELPKRLIIIGAGYIGVEIAFMLAEFGVKITMFEALDRILPQMDEEISQTLNGILRERADVTVNAKVIRIEDVGVEKAVTVQTSDGEKTYKADAVLTAIGRGPNVGPEIGLANAGIHFDARSGIFTDAFMRTNQPHIFAAGDVTTKSMLFHAAARMSQVAAYNILYPDRTPDTFNPLEMPATVFSDPEAHTVGYTMAQAEANGMHVFEIRRPMGVEARAQILEETRGFFKMIVEKDTEKIVGVQAVGVDAAAISSISHIAVRQGLTIDDLSRMTFPHPTQFEIFDRIARKYIH